MLQPFRAAHRIDTDGIAVAADSVSLEAHSYALHYSARRDVHGLVPADDPIEPDAAEALVAQRDGSLGCESPGPVARVEPLADLDLVLGYLRRLRADVVEPDETQPRRGRLLGCGSPAEAVLVPVTTLSLEDLVHALLVPRRAVADVPDHLRICGQGGKPRFVVVAPRTEDESLRLDRARFHLRSMPRWPCLHGGTS